MKSKKYFQEIVNDVKSGLLQPWAKGNFKDCYAFPEYVVLKENDLHKPFTVSPAKNQIAISRLKSLGFKTPQIVYYTGKDSNYHEVQERAKGDVLFKIVSYERLIRKHERIDLIEQDVRISNKDRFVELLSAPAEQFADYFKSIFIAEAFGLAGDLHANNLMYDNETGFSIIDLPGDLSYITEFEDMEKELSARTPNPFELEKKLLQPFHKSVSFGIISAPFYNLIGHKIFEGLKQSDIKLNEYSIMDYNTLLTGKNDKHEFSKACSDEVMKLTLIDMGLLEPSKSEAKSLELIKSRSMKQSPIGAQHLYFHDDRDFRYDKRYLTRCIENFNIEGKPAIDYFKEIDGTLDSVKKDFEKTSTTTLDNTPIDTPENI